MSKKKKITITISVIVAVIILMISLFIYSLSAVDKKGKDIIFTVNPGDSKVTIVDNLESSGLVKSKFASLIYLFMHKNANLQAGTYKLSQTMNLKHIVNEIENGNTYRETYNLTFVEGKRLTYYAETLSKKLDMSKDEIINELNDKEYLQELIDKYWFLTDDILNSEIYYPLEGYLYPSTYNIYADADLKSIIEKLLDTTGSVLESYKGQIESGKYNVHEVLSMASIIELEAVNAKDRKTVSQVIHSRLEKRWTLGMDVTTYYGVQKEMGSTLTKSDLNNQNGYNTRNANKGGLPVGPICNPSKESIDAVFNPTDTDYMYFYADIKTGIVHFAKTSSEFSSIIREFGGN